MEKKMISGHGIDLVDVTRFADMDMQRLDSMANRVLTEDEMPEYKGQPDIVGRIRHVAKMWAIKEAVAKSFGTGIRDAVVWQNIIVDHDELGKPTVTFDNELVEYANGRVCHISVSHDGDNVIASAILAYNNNSFN
jgi:holo-[acyl-carrier-protein] synthase